MITAEETLAALEEVVAEKGADYRYPHRVCVYTSTSDEGVRVPSCIVGHVFFKLNVQYESVIDEMMELNSVVAGLHDEPNAPFTPAAVDMLTVAQNAQDGSEEFDHALTWGEALEHARARARELEATSRLKEEEAVAQS